MQQDHQNQNVPLILNGSFFKIKSDIDPFQMKSTIQAECQSCTNKKIISGSLTATVNFYAHLRRKHPAALKKLEAAKLLIKKRPLESTDNDATSSKVVALTPFQRCQVQNKHSQEELNDLILHYLEEEMLPVTTVEKDSFKMLVSGLSRGINPPCRRTILRKMSTRRDTIVANLTKELVNIDYVCTTADLWSTNNKSYMGVTCHYIDSNLERRSALLACKRLKFSHTHKEIGKALFNIHKSYNLSSDTKIVGTVTDNASNFAKSFKVYCVPESISLQDVEFLQELDDVIIEYVPELQSSADDDDDEISLPPHYRCVTHTLNLVATKDVEKALVNLHYKKIYNSTIAKLTALWNICHRSTNASDQIEVICKLKLIIPCPTRWNSFYDAISKILSIKEYLPELFEKLNLPNLKNNEIQFLEEFVLVMKNLAHAIDILQGEYHCYLGYVLPTLFLSRYHFSSLQHLVYCEPLKSSILQGLNNRFCNILDINHCSSKPFLLATITLPKFKLKWLNAVGMQHCYDNLKTLLLTEAEKLTSSQCVTREKNNSPTSEEDEFFSLFNNNRDKINSDEEQLILGSTIQVEVLQYLQDPSKELKSLFAYSSVLAVFRKYNTVIPSSAPVERLFSTGGLLLTPRRNRMNDATFEMHLMLKKNKSYL